MFEIIGKYTTAKVYATDIEEECVGQITQMTNHPAFTQPIAIMPDAHYGKGSCIGFTMPLSNKAIPNVVGVDIGCGMEAWNLGRFDGLDLTKVDAAIRKAVPMGHAVHQKALRDRDDTQNVVNRGKTIYNARSLAKRLDINVEIPEFDGKWLSEFSKKIGVRNYLESIGTLGGGNHFIELGESQETKDIWLVIHSGSRNFGLRVCQYYQKLATDNYKKKTQAERVAIMESLPPAERQAAFNNLKNQGIHVTGYEYLEGADLMEYLFAMIYAQRYALINRRSMAMACVEAMGYDRTIVRDRISSIHNFIDPEDGVIRKGSCSAREHEEFVVPFNMRDGIALYRGKGNQKWNCSAPHGAGRTMSRRKAKETITMEKFCDDMKSVYSTSVCQSTLDEAPDAYKNADKIMAAMTDTGELIDRLVPLLNIKAR